jgi:serine/threonine protein kinase
MGTEGANFRVIAGRYRLEATVGRGGMGVVWRATDQLLGRQVAVKELPLDETLSAAEARGRRDRTLREARALAQLSHPHLVVVHDVVEHDERPYIVMELIDGGSLADRIASRGPVGAREAARIGADLLSALRTAHAAGVLHRDIKPDNVLLESGTGRVVLTDFGIAQVAGATTLTESGSFVGSSESDLWSVGALLCTALSGESPFRRDSLGGILHAVVSAEIRPPAQAAPILAVVLGLLERDPERRLDAAEAEGMLRGFLATGRTPGRRDVTGGRPPSLLAEGRPVMADGRPALPEGRSTRAVLAAVLLVAAMAGAGISAAALLVDRDGNGNRLPPPSSSAPTSVAPSTHSPTATATATTPTATVTVTQKPSSPVSSSVSSSPTPHGLPPK